MFRPLLFVLAFAFACGGGSKPPVKPSNKILVLVDHEGVGLNGNDPISYSTDTVTEGEAEQTSDFGGAKYQFATPENKQTFDSDKKKYAPQFGGYCAFAASQNRLSVADPNVYMNFEGQLLMFTNKDFLEQFKKDPAGNKKLADKNWPGLVEKHGKATN
jgi:YHS domain-containing protein